MLRPYGLQCGDGTFIHMATRTLAEETRGIWAGAAQPPPTKVPTWRPATIAGTSIVIFLFAWAFYTAEVIKECNAMGCCLDNADTLNECIEKWANRS